MTYWQALLPPALEPKALDVLRTASDYLEAVHSEKLSAHLERRAQDMMRAQTAPEMA